MINTLYQEQVLTDCESRMIEQHGRVEYVTPRGPVWTQARTVTLSEGIYRLEFVFDDVDEKCEFVRGGTIRSGEVIVYAYPFKDESKFDKRGRLIS